MRVLKAHDDAITDLAFSPDGRAIAASDEYLVYLWNLEATPPSRVNCESGDFKPKGRLHFSADGRSVLWLAVSPHESSSTIGNLWRIYDRDTRDADVEYTFAHNKKVQREAHSLDRTRGISLHGMPDYRLIGWRLSEDVWVQTWSVSTAEFAVETPTLSHDGRFLAMLTRPALGEGWSNKPRRVEVRNLATARIVGTGAYTYKYPPERLLFSHDNTQLVAFNGMNLLVWSVDDSGNLGPPRLIRNTRRKHFTAMAFHPSGRRLYVTSNGEESTDATVHVFDAITWNRIEQFTWKLGNLKAVAISPDGMLAAAGGDRGDIVIWDIDL